MAKDQKAGLDVESEMATKLIFHELEKRKKGEEETEV